jgi:uncharacterized protein YndB with AHSA1/START domain
VSTTRVTRLVRAPRSAVYAALLDPEAVPHWKVPPGMTCEVHELDGRVGGAIRVSLTYLDPTRTGKSAARTDTYHGRFVALVPDRQVVEVDEFETDDPALRGPMTITVSLSDADGGTEVSAVHEGLPDAVAPEDNETGWRESLTRLAALVEAGPQGPVA